MTRVIVSALAFLGCSPASDEETRVDLPIYEMELLLQGSSQDGNVTIEADRSMVALCTDAGVETAQASGTAVIVADPPGGAGCCTLDNLEVIVGGETTLARIVITNENSVPIEVGAGVENGFSILDDLFLTATANANGQVVSGRFFQESPLDGLHDPAGGNFLLTAHYIQEGAPIAACE